MLKVFKLLALMSSMIVLFAGEHPLSCGSAFAGSSEVTSDSTVEFLEQFWRSLYSEKRSGSTGEDLHPYTTKLLAKAKPDECYYGVGEANIYPFDFTIGDCSCGKPKVNESYVFGLTKAGKYLWFGTAPNMGCLVFGTIAEQGIPAGLIPFDTDIWTCEYGKGVFGQQQGLPEHLGDWRPPAMYVYNTEENKLEEKITADPLLWQTLGLRAAGSLGNVVFLAGPAVTGVGGPGETAGVNMFAFHAFTGEYFGSHHFAEFNNIRKWIAVDGILYAGVLINRDAFTGAQETSRGAILRWIGNESNPFDFQVIGWVDGDPAELAAHEGRLFASTWPDLSKFFQEEFDYAGLWMSPAAGPEGLRPDDATGWEKVWSAIDYEPDEVVARLYNGGALASFDGYLYWGTTHAPLSGSLAHATFYGFFDPENPQETNAAAVIRAILGTQRPISIFRGKNFASLDKEISVLYGLAEMPAYVMNRLSSESGLHWTILPNRIGPPLYGPAGFGNFFNTYTWTMAVYNDDLFVGTMDWSHMFTAVMLPVVLKDVINPLPKFELPRTTHGADLFVFPSSAEQAVELSRDGIHNYGSHGIRTMATSEDALYLGMANATNLMTNPEDGRSKSGWELIRLSAAECETRGMQGDFSGNGSLSLEDLEGFFACFTGACEEGLCDLPLYEDPCCSIGDFDADGDVDWKDFTEFLNELRKN